MHREEYIFTLVLGPIKALSSTLNSLVLSRWTWEWVMWKKKTSGGHSHLKANSDSYVQPKKKDGIASVARAAPGPQKIARKCVSVPSYICLSIENKWTRMWSLER